MVEFKVVVSDPEASNSKVVPVIVEGSANLRYGAEEKSGKSLPVILMSKTAYDKVQTPYGIVTLRVWKDRSKNEKVKFTLRARVSPEIPDYTAYVPKDLLVEKLGVERAYGEVFRARAFQIVVDGDKARRFVGLKIGDVIDASVVGISGRLLKITGGSDNSGFPMIQSLSGPAKRAVLLSSPPGFRPREEGERRKKLVRGNTVSEEIVQINTVLVAPQARPARQP